MIRRAAFLVAGFAGVLGIALGAFGAHAFKGILTANHTQEIWNTAVLYHLIHIPVLLWLAGRKSINTLAVSLFAVGILIFSGSLYVLAFTDIVWFGAITPIGGLLLLAGWFWIAFYASAFEESRN